MSAEIKRRIFLKRSLAASAVGVAATSGLLAPLQVLAACNKEAFEAKEPTDGIDVFKTIRWTADPGADHYEIEIATGSDFTTIAERASVEGTRYVSKNGLWSTDRYWHVRSVSARGTPGSWSSTYRYNLTRPANTYTVHTTDSLSQIQITLNEAAANAPAIVSFENGTYYLNPSSGFALTLTGKANLVIDGNGADIVITNPRSGFLQMNSCTNVVIQGFSFDYNPLPHVVGTVTSIDTNNNQFVVSKMTGYPDFDNTDITTNFSFGILLDRNIPGKVKDASHLNIPATVVSNNGNGEFTLETDTNNIGFFSEYDKFVAVARDNGNSLFGVCDSKDITFFEITNYASSSMQFVLLECEDVKLLNNEVRIKSGRWFATNADFCHSRGATEGPWIEGNVLDANGDDAIALFNKGEVILEKLSPTSIVTKNMHTFNIQTGDTICLFNPRDGAIIADNLTVTNISGPDNYRYTIEFSPSISASLVTTNTDLNFNDQVFNKSRMNNRFVIKFNEFKNIYHIGAIVRGNDGFICNNSFSNCSSGAIALMNQAQGWHNGLYCSNVKISDNYIEDSAFDYTWAWRLFLGSINVEIRTVGDRQPLSTKHLHQGIVIDGNTIVNGGPRAINVGNATGVMITHNTITNTWPATKLADRESYGLVHTGIHVEHCDDIDVIGNDLTGETRPVQNIVLTNCTGYQNQLDNQANWWSRRYKIKNRYSQKFLIPKNHSNNNDVRIVQIGSDSSNYAKWKFIYDSQNIVSIKNIANYKAMRVTSSTSGVCQHTYDSGWSSEKWRLVPVGDGVHYFLTSYAYNTQSMRAYGSTDDGKQYLYTTMPYTSMQYELVSVD